MVFLPVVEVEELLSEGGATVAWLEVLYCTVLYNTLYCTAVGAAHCAGRVPGAGAGAAAAQRPGGDGGGGGGRGQGDHQRQIQHLVTQTLPLVIISIIYTIYFNVHCFRELSDPLPLADKERVHELVRQVG